MVRISISIDAKEPPPIIGTFTGNTCTIAGEEHIEIKTTMGTSTWSPVKLCSVDNGKKATEIIRRDKPVAGDELIKKPDC